MKFEFIVRSRFCSPFPGCINESPLHPNYDPVSQVLSDDGGLGLEHMRDWAGEGTKNLSLVMSGELESYEWGGEMYSAEMNKHITRIYCQLDDDIYSDIETVRFFKLFMAWKQFIDQPLAIGMRQCVEL